MQAINAVDLYLLGFLNRFAHRSPIFDQSISFLANQPPAQGGASDVSTVAGLVPTKPQPETAPRTGHFNPCRDRHIAHVREGHQTASAVSATADA